MARELVGELPAGTLILADLGYFGFHWFDDLTDAGYWWVSRLRAKTSCEPIHCFYQDGETWDGVVWLGAYRADRAKHAVRLIQFRRGQQLHRYVTNVRDPAQCSLHELATLYARRWDIELGFRLIKRELGLHLLWSGKEAVIAQQVWGGLIVAQIVLGLRQEVASRAGAEPDEVSLPLLLRWLPRYAASGQDPLAAVVEQGWAAGFIRPARRVVIQAPEIAVEQLAMPPPDLLLECEPRYAGRKAGSRSAGN